jgi:hypothetical protein
MPLDWTKWASWKLLWRKSMKMEKIHRESSLNYLSFLQTMSFSWKTRAVHFFFCVCLGVSSKHWRVEPWWIISISRRRAFPADSLVFLEWRRFPGKSPVSCSYINHSNSTTVFPGNRACYPVLVILDVDGEEIHGRGRHFHFVCAIHSWVAHVLAMCVLHYMCVWCIHCVQCIVTPCIQVPSDVHFMLYSYSCQGRPLSKGNSSPKEILISIPIIRPWGNKICMILSEAKVAIHLVLASQYV